MWKNALYEKGPLDMGKFKQKIDEGAVHWIWCSNNNNNNYNNNNNNSNNNMMRLWFISVFFSILYVINFQVWNDERSNHHYVLIFQVVPLGLHPNVRFSQRIAANRKGMSIAKRVSMVSKWDAVIWCASMDIGTAHLASSRSVWSRLIFLVDECTSKEFRFHGDVVSNANQYSKVHIFTALISLTLMAPSLNKVSLSNNSFVHYKLFTPTHLPIVSCPKYTVYYPKTMDSERLTLN